MNRKGWCRLRDEYVLVQKLIQVIAQQLWDEFGIEQLLSAGGSSLVGTILECYGTFIAVMSYFKVSTRLQTGQRKLISFEALLTERVGRRL